MQEDRSHREGRPRLSERFIRYSEVLILAVMAVAALASMANRILRLPHQISLDYNEGWNALQADLAMRGGALYPELSALTSNNYPPLSFYIVGALGALIGDNIIAGRILALLSLCIVAGNIVFLVRRFGGSSFGAGVATLFFVGFHATQANVYIALNDPQWIAHALMMTGFSVFVAGKITLGRLVSVAILMLAAGFVKHLLFAAPIAVTIWLAYNDRRHLMLWLITGGGLAIGALLTCNLLYGPTFLESLLAAPRVVSAEMFALKVGAWFTPLIVPLIGAGLVLLYGWRRDISLLVLFIIGGLVEAAIAIGGAGINVNAAFDLVIGLSIISGLALDKAGSVGGPSGRILATAALASFVVLSAPRQMQVTKYEIADMDRNRVAWAAEIERLRAIEGAVGCETLSLCYWADRGFEIDLFNYGQKLATGAISTNEGLAALEARGVHALQIAHAAGASGLLPTEFNDALAQRYHLHDSTITGFTLLIRRTTEAAASAQE